MGMLGMFTSGKIMTAPLVYGCRIPASGSGKSYHEQSENYNLHSCRPNRQQHLEKIAERKREMTEIIAAVISAVITGGVTLLGVLIANGKSQAVTETKLDELTREVREHNNFARRMPVVEEQIKVINHRIQDLEDGQRE